MKESATLLDHGFFERSPLECARELIGCRLEWQGCAGVIVETVAYEAAGDAACHTHVRPSARQFIPNQLQLQAEPVEPRVGRSAPGLGALYPNCVHVLASL